MTSNPKNNKSKEPWIKSKHQICFDSSLGNLLKEKRKSLGYSREKLLSDLMEFYNGDEFISDDYYGRIERGERSISTYKLLLLVKFLNHSINIYNSKNTNTIAEITL
ncbi:MAG: helix-turn-helix domain-containing protein, partial [Paraclostridium sp.]